jgi:VIT1/CCC1 family predicted Fe2+/Mn2+ transporter
MLRSKRLKKTERHIKKYDKRSPLSAYLKEVIYGAIDGIITTFAVVAGFSGAALSSETTTQFSFMVVLLFGLANLFGDGVSLGLGNFLAVRSEQGLYKNIWAREQSASEENENSEARETKIALIQKGFSEEDAHTLTEIYRRNEAYWVDFIVNNELKISNPMGENPVYTGVATFGAFISFGLIPLTPFVVMGSVDPRTVFQFSAMGAFIALVLLGILKWKVVGTQPVRSVLEVVVVGTIAASVAFLIGTLFSI